MKCPKCGSKHTAPILYGLPEFDTEMERKLDNDELYLGGCCVTDYDPTYHCFSCNKDIASPPILQSKRGIEDYRKIVTSIRFSDGGFFSGYVEILIKKRNGKIVLDIRPDFNNPEGYFQREVQKKEWEKLLDRLYCKLHLHEWKKNYFDPCVLDGEQWELEIKLTNGRVRNYGGSNAFPPYWRELKSTFRPFFKEAGIMY